MNRGLLIIILYFKFKFIVKKTEVKTLFLLSKAVWSPVLQSAQCLDRDT